MQNPLLPNQAPPQYPDSEDSGGCELDDSGFAGFRRSPSRRGRGLAVRTLSSDEDDSHSDGAPPGPLEAGAQQQEEEEPPVHTDDRGRGSGASSLRRSARRRGTGGGGGARKTSFTPGSFRAHGLLPGVGHGAAAAGSGGGSGGGGGAEAEATRAAALNMAQWYIGDAMQYRPAGLAWLSISPSRRAWGRVATAAWYERLVLLLIVLDMLLIGWEDRNQFWWALASNRAAQQAAVRALDATLLALLSVDVAIGVHVHGGWRHSLYAHGAWRGYLGATPNRCYVASLAALVLARAFASWSFLVFLRPALLVSRSPPLAAVFAAILRTLPKALDVLLLPNKHNEFYKGGAFPRPAITAAQ